MWSRPTLKSSRPTRSNMKWTRTAAFSRWIGRSGFKLLSRLLWTHSGLLRNQVAGIFAKRSRRKGMVGDGDPLDIACCRKEHSPRDILLTALPIGGLSMADGGEADDKIIAVMRDDAVYGGFTDISQCPSALMDRLQHYFLTYKSAPGTTHHKVEITSVYGREEARKVIRASHADYRAKYPELGSLWPKNL